MDMMTAVASGVPLDCFNYYAYNQYNHMPYVPMHPTTAFPNTPTTAFPDTTVKSGSEYDESPPSDKSGRKRDKNDPSYRVRRDRNNEAAKKSRKERKRREETLKDENTALRNDLLQRDSRCRELELMLGEAQSQITALQREVFALRQQQQPELGGDLQTLRPYFGQTKSESPIDPFSLQMQGAFYVPSQRTPEQ